MNSVTGRRGTMRSAWSAITWWLRGATSVLWLVCVLSGGGLRADEAERASAEKLLAALVRNARYGTTFDRVYAWHAERGVVVEFRRNLLRHAGLVVEEDAAAEQAGDASVPTLTIPPACAKETALLLAAMLDLRHSEADAAVKLLQQVVQAQPDNPIAHWYLARAYSEREATVEAVASWERAIALRPGRADLLELYREYAGTLQRARRPDEALAVWMRLEQQFPADRRVREQIAAAMAQEGRWQEALDRYRQLADLSDDPEQRIPMQLQMSEMLLQLKQTDAAVELLSGLIPEVDPEGWLYRDIRGRIETVYRDTRDLAGLSRYYELWLQQQPEDVDVMSRLGSVLGLMGRPQESEAWLKKAVAAAPGDVSVREVLIEQLVRNGRIGQAILQYEFLADAGTATDDHRVAWGLLCLGRPDQAPDQQRAEAVRVWEQLVAASPGDAAVLSRVAELMNRAGVTERARALYQQAMEAAPEQLQYREAFGEFLSRQQKKSEALAVWQGMAEGSQRTRDNLVRLAGILRRAGWLEEAIAVLREACELQPEFSDRLLFADLLLQASGYDTHSGIDEGAVGGAKLPVDDAVGASELIREALGQLDQAAEAAATPEQRTEAQSQRVRILLATGQLDSEILRLQRVLSVESSSGIALRQQLMVCLEAAGRLNEAVEVCQQLTQLDDDKVTAWEQLTALYERTVRYGDAADALEKLQQIDRRGQSEHLRRLAGLEVRMGRYQRAMEVAEQITKSAPGAVASWQFYADIAFEAGQPAAAVAALRKAVRINPDDEAALKSLAKTLADEFQTAEAMELYWRAFERSAESDSREALLISLTDLALRSQTLPALLQRLEERSREGREPGEATRDLATVARESGDFRKARAALESLLAETPENTTLLTELVALAEREKNAEAATRYQLQLLRITRDPDDVRRLLAMENVDLRQFSPGDLIRESVADRPLRTDVHTAIRLAESLELTEVMLDLCRKQRVADPEDWWSLLQLARLAVRGGQSADAEEAARAVLSLTLPMEAVPASSGTAGAGLAAPSQFAMAELTAWQQPRSGDATTFGDACAECLGILAQCSGPMAVRDVIQQRCPQQLGWGPVVAIVESAPAEFRDDTLLWAVDEALENSQDVVAVVIRFRIRQRLLMAPGVTTAERDRGELETACLGRLRQLVSHPEWLLASGRWSSPALFRLRREDYRGWLLEMATSPQSTLPHLLFVLQQAVQWQDASLLRQFLSQMQTRNPDGETVLQLRRQLEQTDQRLLTGMLETRDDVRAMLQVLLRCRQMEQRALTPRLLAISQPGAISFRHQVAAADVGERLISQVLARAVLVCEGTSAEVTQQLGLAESTVSEFGRRMLQADLLRQRGELVPMLYQLLVAAEQAPEATDLRLWIAEQIVGLDLIDEAIAVAERLATSDPRVVIDGELLVLNVSLANDRPERARQAALRLTGLPLSRQQQLSLIPVLDRLGMGEDAQAIEARLGRGAETRVAVLGRQLQSWMNSANQELAAEAAWELLKLSSGGNLFSGLRPNDDRDDGGERLQAIKALGRLGRLQPLIDRYETMLAASPDSMALLEILAEFHEAAEQWELLNAKRDRIAVLSNRVPPGLKKQAAALETAGKTSEACDLYLQFLKEDPLAFEQEIETIYQAFERANRRADFLDAVLRAEPSCWRDHSRLLLNVLADVSTSGQAPEVVAAALSTLLQNVDTRRTAIATVLARPGLATESTVLPAILDELTALHQADRWNPAERRVILDEVLRILGRLQDPESWNQALSVLKPESVSGSEIRVVQVFVSLARNDHAAASQQLVEMLEQVRGQESRGAEELLAIEAAALFLLQERLADQSPSQAEIRLQILQGLLTVKTMNSDLSQQTTLALVNLYEQTGRPRDAQDLLLQQVRNLRPQQLAAAGPETIRRLLQTAEQIQHSGYPVDATGLLLSVTSHDVDRFTRDLGEDKAIAFRSRWNAARRWGLQQIGAEQMLKWLERCLEEPATSDAGSPFDVDLLLELSGTSDPGCIDVEKLREIRAESLLFQAITRAEFSEESTQSRLLKSLLQMKDSRNLPAGLTCAAVLLTRKLPVTSVTKNLHQHLMEQLVGVPMTTDKVTDAIARAEIPVSLRTTQSLAKLLLIRESLVTSRLPVAEAESLIGQALNELNRCPQRLVRLCVLNEALALLQVYDLPELRIQVEALRQGLIEEQTQQSNGRGTESLAEEIRVRLLRP